MKEWMCCLTCEGEGTVISVMHGKRGCPNCRGTGKIERPANWERVAREEGCR